MPVSPVNSASLSFSGKKVPKKKIKTKNVVKAALGLTVAGAAVAYATQKGKGGLVDLAIARLQPVKVSVLEFLSNILNKISP